MPSLRTLDVVHRLNAPTRAAATRRRRLRKAGAITCLLVGAALAAPSGGAPAPAASAATSGASADGPAPAALRGRHIVRITAVGPNPQDAARVDVWDASGTRLVSCAPTYPGSSRVPARDVMSNTSPSTVSIALTDAETVRVAKHLGNAADSGSGLLVTGCP